jgi:DNA-binding NarL/FixJ family response regulator
MTQANRGSLTSREREVLSLMWDGHSTKQIAGDLNISFKTAVFHRKRLMEKAGVHDSISLLRWALQNGYVKHSETPKATVGGQA